MKSVIAATALAGDVPRAQGAAIPRETASSLYMPTSSTKPGPATEKPKRPYHPVRYDWASSTKGPSRLSSTRCTSRPAPAAKAVCSTKGKKGKALKAAKAKCAAAAKKTKASASKKGKAKATAARKGKGKATAGKSAKKKR